MPRGVIPAKNPGASGLGQGILAPRMREDTASLQVFDLRRSRVVFPR